MKPARRQRGSVLIIAAATLTVMLLATALAVDIGRISWEQRRLQLVADLAAMEAALTLGDCSQNVGVPLSVATAAATASATRNDYAGDPLGVRLGTMSTDASGVRNFAPSPGNVEAVEVTASKLVPKSMILPGVLVGEQRLTAVAVSRTQAVATLQVGSFLLRLDTSTSPLLNALLGQLLGTSVNLDLVSYEGLVNANVRLLDLINAAADVGTIQELLNLDLGLGEFNLLMANALSNVPGTEAVRATLLQLITAGLELPRIHLGDVLDVQTPFSPAALNAEVNVFDLLFTAAQVANARNAVAVDLATPFLAITGLADINLGLYIIEAPQIAVGPAGRDQDGEWITRARSGQVNLQLDLSLLGLLDSLTGSGGLVNLNLYVALAETRARLERFECRGNPTPAVIVGAVPQAARIGIGSFSDIEDLNPTIEPSQVLDVLGLIGIEASAELSLGTSSSDPIYLDFEEAPSTQTVAPGLGTSVNTLLDSLADDLVVQFTGVVGSLLNFLLNALGLGGTDGILDLVLHALQPIISALSPLLDFLFNLLGLQVGGADISILDITVGRPELVR